MWLSMRDNPGGVVHPGYVTEVCPSLHCPLALTAVAQPFAGGTRGWGAPHRC